MRLSLLLLLALTLAAQTPSFEVASIRPGNRTNTGSLCRNYKPSTDAAMLSAIWPLNAVIRDAYFDEVDDFDLPQWSSTGNYAINAKMPPNTTVETCRKMLQNFLAERFHMVTGVEIREVAHYYLKVAKSGLKLKPVAGPPADLAASYSFTVQDGVDRHVFRGAPMDRILAAIAAVGSLDARACRLNASSTNARIAGYVDETGLTGYYNGEFQFAATASVRDELAETLNDALTRQLGLTLELRRAPGKVLVIRSSDRAPTEN